MLVRVLAGSITDATYFERLLTKFSTPDELFGAVMMSELMKDNFKRNTAHHLPNASFAFIDEIFKANSAILNALLTLINERIFHNNGTPMNCPLETMVGCSNEFPDGTDLDALYDRFLLKYIPRYIQEDAAFVRMLRGGKTGTTTKLTLGEVHELQKEAASLQISDEVVNFIAKIRRDLAKQGVIPSDRRFKEAQKCAQGYSLLNGRKVVTPDDLRILGSILWDREEEIPTVQNTVMENINPHGKEVQDILKGINEAVSTITNAKQDADVVLLAAEATSKMRKGVKRLEEIVRTMKDEGRDVSVIETDIKKAKERTNKIVDEHLGV